VPTFKYASLYQQVPDAEKPCPPSQAKGRERPGFHFVFSPPVDARSFQVHALKLGNRFGQKGCCSDCGVSFFETEEQARVAFAKFMKSFRQFNIRSGDHLARIDLQNDHGAQTDTDDKGHFDLHEYAGVDLVPLVVVIGPL